MVLDSNNMKQNLGFGSNTYVYGNNINPINPQLNAHMYPNEMVAYNSLPKFPLNINYPHSTHRSLNIDRSSVNPMVHNFCLDPLIRLNSPYSSNHSAGSFGMKNNNGAMANSSSNGGGMIYKNSSIMKTPIQPPTEIMREANPQKPPRIIIQEIGSSNSWINGNKMVDDPKAKRKNERIMKNGAVKGHWNSEEDRMLTQFVEKYGANKWSLIARMMPGRLGKQLRERYNNHLKPGLKKDAWSKEEDMQLIEAHASLGNKWAEISKILPGRSESDIKNRWNATKRKCLNAMKNVYRNPKPSTVFEDYVKNIFDKTDQNHAAAASAESKAMEDGPSDNSSSTVNQIFPDGPNGVEEAPVDDDNGLESTFGPNVHDPIAHFDNMSFLDMLCQ